MIHLLFFLDTRLLKVSFAVIVIFLLALTWLTWEPLRSTRITNNGSLMLVLYRAMTSRLVKGSLALVSSFSVCCLWIFFFFGTNFLSDPASNTGPQRDRSFRDPSSSAAPFPLSARFSFFEPSLLISGILQIEEGMSKTAFDFFEQNLKGSISPSHCTGVV